MVGAHLQCVNNHHANFDIKEWTDYTQITLCKYSKGSVDVIMAKFNTPKYIIKCAQNIGCTCSMCEQS